MPQFINFPFQNKMRERKRRFQVCALRMTYIKKLCLRGIGFEKFFKVGMLTTIDKGE